MSWRWFLLILFIAAAGWLEAWPLWKRKRLKEAGVYTVLLLSGAVLHILLIHHILIPGPVNGLFRILEPIERSINRMLGL